MKNEWKIGDVINEYFENTFWAKHVIIEVYSHHYETLSTCGDCIDSNLIDENDLRDYKDQYVKVGHIEEVQEVIEKFKNF